MAKGRDKHQAYLDTLNLFGKALVRRANHTCELSGASGRLVIHDLEGAKVSPKLEHLLLVTERMKAYLDGEPVVESELRCLETAVWSTEIAVRRAATELLSRLHTDWAKVAIENAEMMDKAHELKD